MEKCHCSGVRFEKVVETAKRDCISFREAAKFLDVSETCTACKEYMIDFCEKKMGLEKVHTF
jgi:bacterioferritin-associated ferredoxin